jgi:hypothetical protein
VRAAREDLFALGTREAVLTAVLREDEGALAHFPLLTPDERPPFDRIATPAGVAVRVVEDSGAAGGESRGWHVTVTVEAAAAAPALWLAAGRVVEQVHAVAAAHRLVRTPPESEPTTRSNMAVVDSALWSTS